MTFTLLNKDTLTFFNKYGTTNKHHEQEKKKKKTNSDQ